jgi:hypothetical protein
VQDSRHPGPVLLRRLDAMRFGQLCLAAIAHLPLHES